MDAVDRILSFIDNETEEGEAPEQAPAPQEQPQEQTPEQQPTDAQNVVREQPAEARNEMRPEPPNNNTNYDYTRDEKQYKNMLRKLNNNIKKSRYPCVIEIGGDGNANMMFSNETEIKAYLNNLKEERRRVIKEAKQKEINEYVNKNKKSLKRINTKEYIKNDDELLSDSEDTRKIYKKGPLKAIQHEEDIIEVPRTSKKDRTTLIKNIKKNPTQLKELVRTKDNNEFDIKTEEILRDNEEMQNLYNIHHNNPFNKDITWTRESFLKAMDDMIYEHEQKKQEAKQRLREDTEIRRTRQNNNIYNDYVINSGINPDLMKRY
jgi:hypothetical protein